MNECQNNSQPLSIHRQPSHRHDAPPPLHRCLWEQYLICLEDSSRLSFARAYRNIKFLESERAEASFSLNMLLPASVQKTGFTLTSWKITAGMLNNC